MTADRRTFRILALPGDGIGPEVTAQALKVMRAVEEMEEVRFEVTHALIGGAAIDVEGVPITMDTLQLAKESDAVLLGAVGGEKWDGLPTDRRPEKGLLAIRSSLDLFANLRPASVFEPLISASTVRPEVVAGIDILVVRELVSGIYFGTPRGSDTTEDGRVAYNTMRYRDHEVERVAIVAFEAAMKRKGKVTSVDKANVLEVSGLWREVVNEVARGYPRVALEHMYVDNCSMQLIRNPSQFDVILTGNLFGDILSDEAAMLTGSIGMLPSASVGGNCGLYEPVHGSAPDIAGQDKANPLASILSFGMMLDITCGMSEAARKIQASVGHVLESGWRTGDIFSDGSRLVSCDEMGSLVAASVRGEKS